MNKYLITTLFLFTLLFSSAQVLLIKNQPQIWLKSDMLSNSTSKYKNSIYNSLTSIKIITDHNTHSLFIKFNTIQSSMFNFVSLEKTNYQKDQKSLIQILTLHTIKRIINI